MSDSDDNLQTTDMILNDKALHVINVFQEKIIFYTKYSLQLIIWWGVFLISIGMMGIKGCVDFLYIKSLYVNTLILERSEKQFPESPMKRVIKDKEDEPYLLRYYLLLKNRKRFPFNIFIHKILKSDEDHVHDHPWAFFHLILSGGYWEEVPIDGDINAGFEKIWRGPGYWNIISSEYKHRIQIGDTKPWTIMIPLKQTNKWGFWVEEISAESPTGKTWRKMTNTQYMQERSKRTSPRLREKKNH